MAENARAAEDNIATPLLKSAHFATPRASVLDPDPGIDVFCPANNTHGAGAAVSDFDRALTILAPRQHAGRLLALAREHIKGCVLVIICVVLVGMTAALDYGTGPELSLAIFYLLPIAAAAWWGGFAHGILLAVASVIAWHVVEIQQHPSMNLGVSLWNGIVRFCFFVITSSLLTRQRVAMRREQAMARTDPLTGAANARTFYEVAQMELLRVGRTGRPFTMAYLDVDDFKAVNDRLGHAAGDALLVRLAETIRLHTRGHDLLARLGGDEFAILLPETDSSGATASLMKLRENLVQSMAATDVHVTYSIGAATFLRPPADVDAMVRRVDALMYVVKRRGKNQIHHEIVADVNRPLTDPGTGERRGQIRAMCTRPVRVVCDGGVERQLEFAKVRDLSVTGIGLELSAQVDPGTLLTVEPVCDGKARTLLARVVRSERVDGGWVHGCELAQQLNTEELQAWLGHQPP
jgi:diguanylate cyclase (GGDEF)-like protein